MNAVLFRSAMACALLALCLSTNAQQMKIESQGQAAVDAETQRMTAVAMAEALGQPPGGKGQVVFFRSAKSPGASAQVQENGSALGELPAGMYFVAIVAPGAHSYGVDDSGNTAAVNVAADKTHYVQVIRNRSGRTQLLRSNATAFQRASK